MYTQIRLLTAALCLALTTLAVASDDPRIEHSIESGILEQTRQLTVQLPASYSLQSEYGYPVLYLLDGESNLDFTEAVANFLAENGLAPEMIVVALHAGPTRAHDYLPSGEAESFLRFIEKELMPFVEDQYRAAPLRILSGHSYGGVFVTYALAARPGLFHGYIAQSPYFDPGIGAGLLKQVSARVAKEPGLEGFYYMNLGQEPSLAPQFSAMQAVLEGAASNSFSWSSEQHSDMTHMTTRLIGQYDGLARLFADDWPLSQQLLVNGRGAALASHLEKLNTKYGYPVLLSERSFLEATLVFMSLKDPTSATNAARLYCRQYSRSPLAHFMLAQTLASSDMREQALEAGRQAVALYEADPRAEWQPLAPQMKQLLQQLGEE